MLYNAALAIREGTPRIEHFTDERVKAPKLEEAMDKVRMEVVAKWDSRVGEMGTGRMWTGNPVTIHLKNGRVVTKVVPRDQIVATQQTPLG